jgi:para-nitrobenzyl esterase
MTTDGYRGKLRFVPPGLALGRVIGLRGPQRRPYLRANRDVRRKGTAAVLGHYATDRIFRTLVPRVAIARGDAPTWVYRFSWVSPPKGWSCHCLDVPFFFDCLDAERAEKLVGEDPPVALVDAVHGSAVAFARTGDPGWPAWSRARGTTRVFGGPASAPDVITDGYAEVAALLSTAARAARRAPG